MMSDPTLGFQVDTSGLDKGSQSLDKITQSAAKTEQQAGKTSDALNKMGSGSSGNSIAKTAQSVDKMAESLVNAAREAQKNLDVTKSLETIVSKTGTSYTQAATALQSAINAHKSSAAAVATNTDALKKSAEAHTVLSTQAQSAFHSIRSVAEGALSGASPIQMLTQQINHLGYAASGQGGLSGAFSEVAGKLTGLGPVMGSLALGVGGTVAAFVAASVELTKVGDEVERSKSRLTGITGSTKAGAEAFNQIKQAANSAGVEFSSLSSFVEKASQGIDKMNTGWPVITVGANKALDAIREMGATLGKVMQTAGATAAEESQVFGALAASIAKGGGLTADTFEKIRDTLPQVARAIASAFSVTDINEFQKSLERQPKSLQDVEEAIKRIKPAVDAAFDSNKPKTFEQAIRGLSIQWKQFLEDLAKTGAFDLARDALAGIGKTLQSDIQDALAFVSALNSVASAAANAASGIGSVASNVGSVISGAGRGGSDSAQYDAMGNVTSSGGSDQSPYAFDNSEYLSGLDHYATGGSFTVGGTGGTDSQLIQFMATPGEKVTIDPPGGSGDGAKTTLGSLLPSSASGGGAPADLMSAHFSEAIKTQTTALSDRINASRDAIVLAVNNSASKVATSATSTSGASTISSAVASTPVTSNASNASSFGSSVDAGVGAATGSKSEGQFGSSWSLNDNKTKQDNQEAAPINVPVGAFGQAFGRGGGVKGYSGSFPVIGPNSLKNPLNPLDKPAANDAGLKQQTDALKQTQKEASKTVADQVKAQEQQAKSIGDTANNTAGDIRKLQQDSLSSLGDVGEATETAAKASEEGADAAKDGVDATKDVNDATKSGNEISRSGFDQMGNSLGQTTQEISSGSSSIVSSVDSAASFIASAVESAISSIASMADNGSPSNYGGGYSGSDYSGGSSDYGGTDYASQVGDGTLPAFASGGQFTVSGSGGADTEHVEFMATPGEVVTVTPPGGTPPPNPKRGSGSGAKGGIAAYATGGQFTVGDAMMPAFSGADAAVDLISAHTNDSLSKQTLSIKDAGAANTAKILAAITGVNNTILSAINSLSSSVSSALSSASASNARTTPTRSSSSSSGGNTMTEYERWAVNRWGMPQNPALAAMMFGSRGMSEGGTFVVPGGSSGNDSVDIGIKASPGERIMVLPPEKADKVKNLASTVKINPEPLSKFIPEAPVISGASPMNWRANDNIPGSRYTPRPSMMPDTAKATVGRVIPSYDPSANPDRNARTVNIYVQEGRSADSFIRSRAEIKRAMGGF